LKHWGAKDLRSTFLPQQFRRENIYRVSIEESTLCPIHVEPR